VHRFSPRSVLLAALAGALSAAPALAAKTDVVHLDNGNVITGEIKSLKNGLLDYSVDHMNRLQIKWDHVVRLTANQQLDIETRDGVHRYGLLIDASADGKLRVVTAIGDFEVDVRDVLFLEPVRKNKLRRIRASVSTGVSYTKSTDVAQFNFGGAVRYRARKYMTQLSINSIVTTTEDDPGSTNSDAGVVYLRYLKNRWFARGDVNGSRNDELGLDFRGGLGGGGGQVLVQNQRMLFYMSGLLTANRENRSDGTAQNNSELAAITSYQVFRHDTPKIDIQLDLAAFLNLTTWGRYRIDFDGRVSIELVKDFYWDVSQIYYRYDSDPAANAASTTDYGFISGLRYKFNY